MKKLILLASALALVSCSSTSNNSRKLASLDKDLTGTYLGVADYGSAHKGYNKKAMRIYFHPIPNQPGS